MFEGIAKTNTTHTKIKTFIYPRVFEGIAKTNTTHTSVTRHPTMRCLRVLLKQIQHTLKAQFDATNGV